MWAAAIVFSICVAGARRGERVEETTLEPFNLKFDGH